MKNRNKMNRRNVLKGVTLGAGATALAPFLEHLQGAEKGDLPKRFVFVVKGSGLQAEYLNPEGLIHGGDSLVDESIEGTDSAWSASSAPAISARNSRRRENQATIALASTARMISVTIVVTQ